MRHFGDMLAIRETLEPTKPSIMEKYPLKPDVAAFINKVSASYPARHSEAPTPDDLRRMYENLCAAFDSPIPSDIEIFNHSVPNRSGAKIPVRTYEQRGRVSGATVVYYHGGGFMLGNLDTHDTICADMAQATGCRVVAVDYRLAPEHRYPAHFEDAVDAYLGLQQGCTIVCGDSAGGTLAAAVSVALRGGPCPPAAQVLIYPFLGGLKFDLPSYSENSDAPLLTTNDVRYFEKHRCDGVPEVDNPAYFPLSCENFKDVAPCYAFAAEHDPIRDDALEYVARLNGAGVEAKCIVEPGLVHGYLRGRHVAVDIADGFARICDAIRAAGEA